VYLISSILQKQQGRSTPSEKVGKRKRQNGSEGGKVNGMPGRKKRGYKLRGFKSGESYPVKGNGRKNEQQAIPRKYEKRKIGGNCELGC